MTIDGISVALPTWNHLNYLKKCLYSLKKYSVLPKTEVSIFVDGSTDGTFEWLEEEGIPYIGRKENIGCYSGWNRAVENSKNSYVLQGEDDLFFGPGWDKYLAKWFEEIGDMYVIMPQLVEPISGSYPPPYDCGKTAEEFNEEKFVEYCKKVRKHEVIAQPTGLWTMKKEIYLSVGGFDEFYDPISRGDLDMILRLHKKYPDLRWIRVWDSLMYHIPPGLHSKRRYQGRPNWKELRKRVIDYFEERWNGMSVPETYASIPVGLRK